MDTSHVRRVGVIDEQGTRYFTVRKHPEDRVKLGPGTRVTARCLGHNSAATGVTSEPTPVVT